MEIIFNESSEIQELKSSLEDLLENKDIKAVMILVADHNEYDKTEFDLYLKTITTHIWGGIFPQLIHNKKNYERGFILVGFEIDIETRLISNISSEKIDFYDYLDNKFLDVKEFDTLVFFIDGFATRISDLVDGVFNLYGTDRSVIGGGAGSLSMEQSPCIISNDGLSADSAIFAFPKHECGIGVAHGWEKVSGPFRVTESNKNEIISLEWRPVFELYKEEVEKHSGKEFNENDFFSTAKAYPFGIKKMDTEDIVRDPLIKTSSDSLLCVGEVPVGSFVDILTGDYSTLIDSSKLAFKRAEENKSKSDRNFVFVIDCISRVLFLEEKIEEELQNTYLDNLPHLGLLTIGEIANSGRNYIEFYNKTIVVGIF